MDSIKVTFLLLAVASMFCSIHAIRSKHLPRRNHRVPWGHDGQPGDRDDVKGSGLLHLKDLREDLMEKRASRLFRSRVRRDSSEEHLSPAEPGEGESESGSPGGMGSAGSSAGSAQGSSLGSSRSRIRIDLALLSNGDTTSGAFSCISGRSPWWTVLNAILMALLVIGVEW